MNGIVSATYQPDVFDVGSVKQAREIILTGGHGITTDERWENETPYLLNLIYGNLSITERSLVIDYGCGIGRIAKLLIEKYYCRVIGVDISASMRALAASYVNSDRFTTLSPEMLRDLDAKADAAIAIWVLQHCFDAEREIARIVDALKPEAKLFTVNEIYRFVPTTKGWMHDGRDVHKILDGALRFCVHGKLDPVAVTGIVSQQSYWALHQRPPAIGV